ncbi:MAG TPA: ABC transporter ATP-binding protein, partial [Blastocatellia bacterium]|nr:ABC transporter ATP-binding protein [Blastocatellia bacterium]
RELLMYYGKLFEIQKSDLVPRVEQLLRRVGLIESADKQLRKFSKGMLQRAGLAQALINDPEVLFLDEPMSGLDPLGRREVRDLISNLREQGKTVIFSSHVLSDVEALCDRVAILNKGRLIESGKLSEILKSRSNQLEAVVTGVNEVALTELRNFAAEVKVTAEGARVRINNDREVEVLMMILHRTGGQLVSINPVRESLEELFVREVSASPQTIQSMQ